MTPREEAIALMNSHGLDRALAMARARLARDRSQKQRQFIGCHLAILDVLEPLADAIAALDAIEKSDPVADLAASLVTKGFNKHELHAAIGPLLNHPIGNEFYNKFCDITSGVPTENRYKIRRNT